MAEIEKIHQFAAIRIERHLVACYAAEDEARFRLQRDKATKGPVHRRFAVSIELSEDFDGGAVGFSYSLLYAVTRVTRGRRYAFLLFLDDEAAAQIREQNAQFVEET